MKIKKGGKKFDSAGPRIFNVRGQWHGMVWLSHEYEFVRSLHISFSHGTALQVGIPYFASELELNT